MSSSSSLALEVNNPVIDNLVKSSLENEDKRLRLEWISYEEITNIEPTPIDNVYNGSCNNGADKKIMLLCLGNSEECTETFANEFARIYSLPTHKYNNDGNKFRRYSRWLESRNELVKGFTKLDDIYYMVAKRLFFHCYSRYGFCAACGILRCSPVWCICEHKELSDEWTSNNKQLDEFIKKSQLQTNSPNDAYLEWIPYDCIRDGRYKHLNGLPIYSDVKLIPVEITDKTDKSYYDEVNYLFMHHVYLINNH